MYVYMLKKTLRISIDFLTPLSLFTLQPQRLSVCPRSWPQYVVGDERDAFDTVSYSLPLLSFAFCYRVRPKYNLPLENKMLCM